MNHPELSRMLVEARAADIERSSAARRRSARDRWAPAADEASVTLRLACADDAGALRWLAERDSAPPLVGPILIGDLAGRPVAALSLTDTRVIADPFERTVAVVELLRARARQLTGAGDGGGARRGGLRRVTALWRGLRPAARM